MKNAIDQSQMRVGLDVDTLAMPRIMETHFHSERWKKSRRNIIPWLGVQFKIFPEKLREVKLLNPTKTRYQLLKGRWTRRVQLLA